MVQKIDGICDLVVLLEIQEVCGLYWVGFFALVCCEFLDEAVVVLVQEGEGIALNLNVPQGFWVR